jgi:hypothetical protein
MLYELLGETSVHGLNIAFFTAGPQGWNLPHGDLVAGNFVVLSGYQTGSQHQHEKD